MHVSAIFVSFANDFSLFLIFHGDFDRWKYQHIDINKSMACSASTDTHTWIAAHPDYILMTSQNFVPSRTRHDADHWPPVSVFIVFSPDSDELNLFISIVRTPHTHTNTRMNDNNDNNNNNHRRSDDKQCAKLSEAIFADAIYLLLLSVVLAMVYYCQ